MSLTTGARVRGDSREEVLGARRRPAGGGPSVRRGSGHRVPRPALRGARGGVRSEGVSPSPPAPCSPQVLAVRIDDLDHLPETTTIDASSIGIVQVSAEGGGRCRRWGPQGRARAGRLGEPRGVHPACLHTPALTGQSSRGHLSFCDFPVLPFHDS